MKTIWFIIQKEFLQVFRNKPMLIIIFQLPVIQLLILSYAATFEIRNINVCVVDQDHTEYSRSLVAKIPSSGYFNITRYAGSRDEAIGEIHRGNVDMILEIPPKFEKDLQSEGKAAVHISADAINGLKAGLAMAYLRQMLMNYNTELIVDQGYINTAGAPVVEPVSQFWYNPFMDYKAFMVPGILVILVTVIGAFLTSMNITREKEVGTIEQINVTPIKKYQFIIGKMAPFMFIGLFEMVFGLVLADLFFDIPMRGSLVALFTFLFLYLLIVLAMGLLISSYMETQQQAMFIAWFFMIIFILMGGLFTAIESMPEWAQVITWFNPIAWFIKVMRLILLTGSTFADLWRHLLAMTGFAIFFNVLAIRTYRKTSS